MDSTAEELRHQWANPSDILSLLLLIGGDIVQKAIAQLVGYRIRLPGPANRNISISITPVAFSFGWVAYAFLSLLSAIGEMKLMPATDYSCLVVNCSNGFTRENKSWVLGRLLRDHANAYPVDPRLEEDGGRAESLRIDIFHLKPPTGPDPDFVWWSGWFIIVVQIAIAVVPWVRFGDWGIFLVTLSGSVFTIITCAMSQWTEEKWAGRKLGGEKVTCLTRGNGHQHIMVFIGSRGCWDLETLATGISTPRPETRWLFGLLAILWTLLLITVSGLTENSWFLIGIGGLGMLQNAFAAGVSRAPGASDIHLATFPRPSTIIGKRKGYTDDPDANVNLEDALRDLADVKAWAPPDVQRAVADTGQAPQMPRWLDTMAVEDGLPAWLDPIKPEVDGGINSELRSSSLHSVGSTYGHDTTENDQRKVITYGEGVHGALIGLEKWVPTAGLAMVQIFFPTGLKYNDESVQGNKHKKFWKRAYHTKSIRKRAEEKRRAEERVAGATQYLC
ncbi:hypothetical protein ANO14919_040370 [Xylariales sp. No.14919]|nr:hypothetical protein ANO14919_040370 [Xylariales sp. No.14919]